MNARSALLAAFMGEAGIRVFGDRWEKRPPNRPPPSSPEAQRRMAAAEKKRTRRRRQALSRRLRAAQHDAERHRRHVPPRAAQGRRRVWEHRGCVIAARIGWHAGNLLALRLETA